MAKRTKPVLTIKKGDTFSLPLVVTNTYNPDALVTKAQIDTEQSRPNPDIYTISSLIQTYEEQIKVDITGWTISCDMDWCGRHIHSFTINITDGPEGEFEIEATSVESSDWIPRNYDADIQFVKEGNKESSETFTISVLKDVTND